MKLDATVMRTMNRTDFIVLEAVETGMKNHHLVPVALVTSIAKLRHGGTNKIISGLLRDKLLSHDRSCGYDGYRLTNSGYDVLALHTLKSKKMIAGFGNKIGTGKESDIYVAVTPEGKQVVLKFHRLGRTSFRDVKNKRDYFNYNSQSKNMHKGGAAKEQANSWLFLSRISALKEYAFMKALHDVGYPTPTPLAHSRHIVVMSLVRGLPLYQIHRNRVSPAQAESIFEQSTVLATRLSKHGLVHCDLNEFNLMVDMSGVQRAMAEDNDVGDYYVRHSGIAVDNRGELSVNKPLQSQRVDDLGEVITEEPLQPAELLEDGKPKPIVTLIDFPQMVSTRHPNAKELFQRDVACLKRFFMTKLKCSPDGSWEEFVPSFESLVGGATSSGDGSVIASDDGEGSCLASKAQLRLDEELQASGFSAEDSKRNMELFYYESNHTEVKDEFKDNIDESEDERVDEVEDIDKNNVEEEELYEGDDDEFDNDEEFVQGAAVIEGVINNGIIEEDNTAQKWAEAERRAKAKVKRHIQDAKNSKSKQGAFRSRNSNKTFVKGKRVMNDFSY